MIWYSQLCQLVAKLNEILFAAAFCFSLGLVLISYLIPQKNGIKRHDRQLSHVMIELAGVRVGTLPPNYWLGGFTTKCHLYCNMAAFILSGIFGLIFVHISQCSIYNSGFNQHFTTNPVWLITCYKVNNRHLGLCRIYSEQSFQINVVR